jgi:hypothetical protein
MRYPWLVLPLLCVACGDVEGAAVTAAVPEAEAGRLVVRKSIAGDGIIFVEGSVSKVRLERVGGQQVFDELRPGFRHPIVDERLPPGEYELETVERPCSGNCERLDGEWASTRCKVKFRVNAEQTTTVALVLVPGDERPTATCAATVTA